MGYYYRLVAAFPVEAGSAGSALGTLAPYVAEENLCGLVERGFMGRMSFGHPTISVKAVIYYGIFHGRSQ